MISVAMAVYNGEKFIDKQLNSIVNQSKVPDEIIITDDSDNENTYLIIKKYIENYKDIRWVYIKNDKRLGYTQNFFKAILATSGDIVFLSDQDDVWEDKKIELMSSCINDDKSISCLCCKYKYIDKNGNTISNVHKYSTRLKYYLKSITSKYFRLDKKEYFKILAFPGMCFVITRELINDLNNILDKADIDNIKFHDLIISYIAARNNNFYIYNEALCRYRMHGDNAIGVNDFNNKSKQDRVEWLSNILQNQVDINKIERTFDNSDANDNLIMLNDLINFNNKRLSALKCKNVPKLLSLMFGINNYLSIKSYIGDFLYIIRNE